ncbi:terminase small subunit [uncultured Tyzzerella sp.]|uniref:terminase small subunit n=1 Tax=uncultured Tyzzerella sp. TaxID=2321398 RepID=UPI002943651F|nr:terminase small subunit [uncultured Tyzzerella sp.]
MNNKQKLFCKYYIETQDIKIATKKCGYKESTGIKLLKNELIKKYIEENIRNNKVADSDEIMECLTKIMRGQENNDDVSLKGISVKERLKAAELLGKVYSIFSPKQEIDKDESIFIVGSDLIKE